MITLAILIGLGMFFIKLFQREEIELIRVLIYASSGGILTFLGLIFVTNFVLSKKALIYILQGTLFVFLQIAFMFLFFYTSFGRVYESLLFFVVSAIFVFVDYVLFSMINIFVVSTEKPLPLINVAKTTSYIFSLIAIYFSTFSIMSIGINIVLTLILFFMLFFVINLMYFMDLQVGDSKIYGISLIISFAMMLVFFAGLMLSDRIEFLAFVPVLVAFIMTNAFNEGTENKFNWFVFIQSFFVLLGLLLFMAR